MGIKTDLQKEGELPSMFLEYQNILKTIIWNCGLKKCCLNMLVKLQNIVVRMMVRMVILRSVQGKQCWSTHLTISLKVANQGTLCALLDQSCLTYRP